MRPRAATVLAASVAIALLLLFPIYHRLGVNRDVLRWGPVTAWGPETTARMADSGPVLSFGRSQRDDQGVTFLLQHAKTRRLDLSGLSHLRLLAACRPKGCTVEVRVLVAPEDPGGGSSPWASLGEEPTEQWLPLDAFGELPRKEGPMAVTLARTQSVRDRDGAPPARVVEIHALEFR